MYCLESVLIVLILKEIGLAWSTNSINITSHSADLAPLRRFWTNVGFAPAAPLPLNNSFVAGVLLSNDIKQNIEVVAALPNGGIESIRTHWILSLVRIVQNNNGDENETIYDFRLLDTFMELLHKNSLHPVVEMMGDLITADFKNKWKDLTIQILQRYFVKYRSLFRVYMETWNEPDLQMYNILNMTLNDYLEYLTGISNGLREFSESTNYTVSLRGPAGLFKSMEKHPLCWGVLDRCEADINACPFDVLTFHRKGRTTSSEIVNDTITLIDEIFKTHPKLRILPYANSEADPTTGWSKSYPPYADVRYASILISIVFQHWNAMHSRILPNLDFISHDNAFLSYHPFEFEQRTLLARFAMNNTNPPHVKFVKKPVHAALGMLASLTGYADSVKKSDNMTCLTTIAKNYGAILCTTSDLNQTNWARETPVIITVDTGEILRGATNDAAYFVEYLENQKTDPYFVWLENERPSFPDTALFRRMRQAEGPHAFGKPIQFCAKSVISVRRIFTAPWVLLLRICTRDIRPPHRVSNLRIRTINNETILLLWKEPTYPMNIRCVRSYQIFYSAVKSATINKNKTIQVHAHEKWVNIANDSHIPFMNYYHHCNSLNCNMTGLYKIRAVDIFDRFGYFCKPVLYIQSKQ